MKKKIIAVLIALLLIGILLLVVVGKPLYDKYSYSEEQKDLDVYFEVSGEERAIILQAERLEEKALVRDGHCYFSLDTVHKYMNEIFYEDRAENLLLYTDAVDTTSTVIEGNDGTYQDCRNTNNLGYPICFVQGDELYVAADYVKLFTNYSFEVYDRQVQIYTRWEERQVADVRKNTSIREKGGVKSEILRKVEAGEKVEVLEQMDNWSRVKTFDGFIGYIENKRMTEPYAEKDTPVTDYVAPEYTSLSMDGKVSLGFHSIGATIGNTTLYSMLTEAQGINVIAPTWFSLCDENGNFRSFAEKSYVDSAHKVGVQVWGVWDNFNFRNETKTSVNEYEVLSSTEKRTRLVNGIIDTAISLGLDGVNIDFEQVAGESGIHYVQFLRELSVKCRENGLILSVDNYVPFHFNEHYRLDIQGQVADYVIVMGYDEHWHGSDEVGSVASIEYVTNGITKTVSMVPANKVVNALPFYTIVWTTNGTSVSDEYLTMNNLSAFLKQVNVEPVWDETTCQNYLEWQSGAGLKQVWLEDADSIRVKLNVMTANEIGGVAVWRIGYGTPVVWELIRLYAES